MQRNTHIDTSSLFVFLSLLSITVQFAAYYFFSSAYLILGIASLISILCTHILLEQSLTYETCFVYNILNIFISGIITFLTYFSKNDSFFPYSDIMIWIAAINWFIPSIHCFLRNMFDYGTRIENYNDYFRNDSIVIAAVYTGILIYGSFSKGAFPWAYRMVTDKAGFTPFWSVATQIEDYINRLIPLSDIIVYLLSRILIYMPYGYYMTILLHRRPKLLKFFALLALPVIIEIFQFIFIAGRCDIDDVIYGFIGGLLGAGFFHLINVIFKAVSGKNFLFSDINLKYNNSALHF